RSSVLSWHDSSDGACCHCIHFTMPKILVVSWPRSFANEATSSEEMKMGIATGVRSVTLPALMLASGLLIQAPSSANEPQSYVPSSNELREAYQRQRQPGQTGGVYKSQI